MGSVDSLGDDALQVGAFAVCTSAAARALLYLCGQSRPEPGATVSLNFSAFFKYAAAAALAAGALLIAASANAGVNWSIGVSIPGVVVTEPAPVYYEPAPV